MTGRGTEEGSPPIRQVRRARGDSGALRNGRACRPCGQRVQGVTVAGGRLALEVGGVFRSQNGGSASGRFGGTVGPTLAPGACRPGGHEPVADAGG